MTGKRLPNKSDEMFEAGRQFVEGVLAKLDSGPREIDDAMRRVGRSDAPIKRLEWIVAFAQLPIADLDAPRRRQLSIECHAFALAEQGHMRGRPLDIHNIPDTELDALVVELRDALNGLADGKPWLLRFNDSPSLVRQIILRLPRRSAASSSILPSDYNALRDPDWKDKLAAILAPGPAAPLSTYAGKLTDIVRWSAADLIAVAGHSLSRCPRCSSLFVRTRRREYCSARCSALGRQERYRHGHSRDERREKRRALYIRQVAKKLGITEKQAAKLVRSRRSRPPTKPA